MARRMAARAENESVAREPLTRLVERLALHLPASSLKNQLVDLAAGLESVSSPEGMAALLYRNGHDAASARRLMRLLRTESLVREAKELARNAAVLAASEPEADAERLERVASTAPNPEQSAAALCAFAEALDASEGTARAVRLLVGRAIERIPDLPPARAVLLLMSAAEAIVRTDTGHATALLALGRALVS
jgi:hypothetical protein